MSRQLKLECNICHQMWWVDAGEDVGGQDCPDPDCEGDNEVIDWRDDCDHIPQGKEGNYHCSNCGVRLWKTSGGFYA